jgi:hypothetical protein
MVPCVVLEVLPRCYPGTRKVVGATGFEPATPCAQEKYSGNLLQTGDMR